MMRNPFDQKTDFSTPTIIDGFRITALLTPSWYIRGNGTINNCELSGSNVGDMIGYSSPCLYVNGGTVSNSLIKDMISAGDNGKILNCDIQKELVATGVLPTGILNKYKNGVYVTGYNVRIEGCCISVSGRNGGVGICLDGNSTNKEDVIDIINCTVKLIPVTGSSYAGVAILIPGKQGIVYITNSILLPPPVGMTGGTTIGWTGLGASDHDLNVKNLHVHNTLSFGDLSSFGSGNVQLLQEAYYVLDTDLSPKSNSPAVNAGDNSFVTTNTDMLGNPRIRGGKVDAGAIESAY